MYLEIASYFLQFSDGEYTSHYQTQRKKRNKVTENEKVSAVYRKQMSPMYANIS